MKFNFKKISAIATSLLMTGMSAGIAAAANYPAPFVDGGVGDVAIVYGASAAITDSVAAGNIQTELATHVTPTNGTTIEGENVLLEKSTDKLNLGNNANAVFVTSVDDDDLPTLLADGTYNDDLNSEYKYTQKIALSTNLGVEHFKDSDYNDNEPSIGIKMSGSEYVLNYTLDFETHPAYNATTLETTNINLLGKNYYILDVKGMGDASVDNKTTLLDSANSATITEGETSTVAGKEVSINYISSTEVRLDVSGETTNSLAEGGTFKLSDGTYIGIKDIMYNSKDAGISRVEISIGTGKLELPNGAEIELNDVTVLEIKSFMVQDSTYKLDKIVLQWTTDDEAFIAPESNLLMPGFEAIKFSLPEFIQPKAEETTVTYSGSDVIELKTTIKSGAVTIPLFQTNSTGEINLLGKSSSDRLITSPTPYLFFNETAGDKYFVASWNGSSEAETYYLKASIILDGTTIKARFTNVVDSSDEKTISNSSSVSFGNIDITLNNITRDGSKKWMNLSMADITAHSFSQLYTKEGMKIYLPYFADVADTMAEGALNYSNTTGYTNGDFVKQGIYNGSLDGIATGHGHNNFYLFFDEEDKDGLLAAGTMFNVTIDDTSDKIHVSNVGLGDSSGTYGYQIGSGNDYRAYVNSDLATKSVYNTGGTQDYVVITYAGEQSYAKLYLTTPESTTSGSGALGNVLVKDSETALYGTKNVIVVGGSCINTAAAALVGGNYCEADWTTATGAGVGIWLVKAYPTSTITSKLALLVAGYEAADTTAAATWVTTQTFDTSAVEQKGPVVGA